MTSSSDNGASSGSSNGGGDGAPRPKTTLRPPEWGVREGPKSAASLTLELQTSEAPVSRRTGPRAELAYHQARVLACSVAGDAEGERVAATAFARALVTRGTELDTAAKLARRALLLGHDAALREELSTWFAALGEPTIAAATLRPLVAELSGSAAARVLTRIGVLLGRAGDATGAADALFDAAREDPSDPVAPELQAAIGAWAPTAVSPERAAEGYLEGFRRREALGDRPAAFEDLLRAFEMAPGEPHPAERLAGALAMRGRVGAADEVWREHARAGGDRGHAVHLRRLREAATAGDLPRALGAAFDARLDAEAAGERTSGKLRPFDDLLERAGLYELLAAALELHAEELEDPERAPLRRTLARMYSGPLASPERALEAWVDALVADPSCQDARDALLGELASTGDPTALVSALLRIARRGGTAAPAALVELASLAEERLRDPGLACWAARRAASLGREPNLEALLARLEPAATEQAAELDALRARSDRGAALREMAPLLRGRLDHVDEYVAVLEELVALDPQDRPSQRSLERVLQREERSEALEQLLLRVLARSDSVEQERVRLGISTLRRRRGDHHGALEVLLPLLDATASHSAAWSFALVLAARRGDEHARAKALLRLAASLSPSVRASLVAVAAESLLSAGLIEEARAAAEQAHRSDPSQARPLGVLAAVALARRPDREVAEALERAMGFIVPRAALCEALAVAHESLGDPILALLWTQRWLTLRPGDPGAVRTLLGRVTETGDAQRLGDALSWLMSQPQPLGELVPGLGAALLRLSELEPTRGVAMARRALEVLGPAARELRQTVIAIADAGGEPGLAIAVLERSLATDSDPHERVELLLEIAARRKAAGDADGAARALVRAVREKAPAKRVLDELSDALPARSSDGELTLLEARAEALAGLPDTPGEAAARAFRELGAARWDLAGDSEGAVAAWERAALLDSEHGVPRLARDLCSFAGYSEALRRLEQFAVGQTNSLDSARLLGVAAAVALGAGENAEALRIARRALDLDPTHTDILAVAERAASPTDLDALELVYDRLADAAMGCYGERAVHYRAARQFERRGELGRALDRAVRAFEVVPAEGITFVLMSRLAERSGSSAKVVRALERVADATGEPVRRARWLERASALGGGDEESTRLRIDVLLRALAVRPDAALIESLTSAIRELGAMSPEYQEIGALRFEHSIDALLEHLEGPEGARVAIAAARAALDLELLATARRALERAMDSDADVDEYSLLNPRVLELGRERAPAVVLVQRIAALSEEKYANVGRALLELGSHLARGLDDVAMAAALIVRAAERDPDDTELARRAALSAQLAGDAGLLDRVAGAMPSAERVGNLMEMALEAERSEDFALAIDALERVAADPRAKDEDRTRARVRLRELYAKTGRHDALERLLSSELERGELSGAALSRAARDLAALYAARGKPEQAVESLANVARSLPGDAAVLEDLASHAGQARDVRQRATALSSLVDVVPDRDKARVLRELAPLLEELGDDSGSIARWQELSQLEPDDHYALAALEHAAEKRGDYERAAVLLARRATLTNRVDDMRRLRLRRATLLEDRLGRADEARTELEALLAATGDHLSVLRVLADLHERLGAPLRAAPLWLRASAVTPDREEAADLGRRACEAYVAGGEVDSARRVLEGMEAWAHSTRMLELRVDIERRSGDARALAAALEELAAEVAQNPKRHLALLIEAARAHDLAGDHEDALAAADRAAEIAPAAPEPQLMARWLEYRVRGPTTREHSRFVVAALRGIEGELTLAQAELRSFLVAEALDSAVGTGAGMRELTKVHPELGTAPLVALGIAERLFEGGEHARALPLFDIALSGDLHEVRQRGRVAIMAADSSRDAGELDRALGYVEIAAADPVTRDAALLLQSQLRAEKLAGEMARDRAAARRERAPWIVEPAPDSLPGPRDSEPPPPPVEPPEPTRRSGGPPPLPVPPSAPPPVPTSPPLGDTTYRSKAPPADVVGPITSPPPGRLSEPAPAIAASPPPPQPAAALPVSISSKPPGGPGSIAMPASLRRISGTFPAASGAESELLERLAMGSVEAGLELMQQLENRRSRSQDLVAVCRRLVQIMPGDRDLLRRLYDSALGDRNHVYARAVEHVLALFDPSIEPVLPPALADQPEDPDRVRSLLFRDALGSAAEALALVWDGAAHVFRREPATYGVTGVERVPLNAPSPLARVYSGAARVLGLSRTPLFQRRAVGPITLGVALLTPPALIVGGEVARETPDLRYHLGAMLIATLPEHVLLFGSGEEQARNLFKGILLAFGPPEEQRAGIESAGNLAEVLWERIPARSQRRLRELCHDAGGIDYDTAIEAARRAVRRAGLFVSGDLAVALRETCRQEHIPLEQLATPLSLMSLCRHTPAVADLIRLATGSEYASVRWQPARGNRPGAPG